MKKLLSILLASLLIVACFGMVGCGVTGKYEFSAIQVGDTVYKIGETYDGEEITSDYATVIMQGLTSFELDKEGVVKDLDGNVKNGYKWEKTDEGINIISSLGALSVTRAAKKDGKQLIFEISSGLKYIYEKI